MKSHFKFNKQERSGIFFLLLIIILLQGFFFYFKLYPPNTKKRTIVVDKEEQAKIDSLKLVVLSKDTIAAHYPFNPNFITDYKGYALGMSVEEIDKIHAYRATGSYVNSAKQFQKVTFISDSLLEIISPYFKFPEWTKQQKGKETKPVTTISKKKQAYPIIDINTVTAKDLKKIRGIGDKLSVRIIKFRDRLGGFIVNEQLYDVYGLNEEVVKQVLLEFQVLDPPKIKKININSASVKEIAKLVYITYNVASKIVSYRENKGYINSFEELTKVDDFPSEKLNRITLYLSLE